MIVALIVISSIFSYVFIGTFIGMWVWVQWFDSKDIDSPVKFFAGLCWPILIPVVAGFHAYQYMTREKPEIPEVPVKIKPHKTSVYK